MSAGVVGPVFAPGRSAHYAPGQTLADGRWHQAALVYQPGESLSLHIDGEVAERSTDNIFPALNAKKLPVRVGVANTKFYFLGDLDEVMIFERALSEREIVTLYRSQRP